MVIVVVFIIIYGGYVNVINYFDGGVEFCIIFFILWLFFYEEFLWIMLLDIKDLNWEYDISD